MVRNERGAGEGMREQDFFRDALSDFTFEAACGGAIRHLTDLGCTVGQIASRLDFPLSYERVQRAAWQRLVDTEVILLEEPGSGRRKKRAVYVREYDQYGKASFRRMPEDVSCGTGGAAATGSGLRGGREGTDGNGPVVWKERCVSAEDTAAWEALAVLLCEKVEENSQECSYMSCDFGVLEREDPRALGEALAVLEGRQREYVAGLPWTGKRVYHRLDSRMMSILQRLYRAGLYRGECFFLKTGEKLVIDAAHQ